MARRSVTIPVAKRTLREDRQNVRKGFQGMIAHAAGKLLADILVTDGINFGEPLRVKPEIAEDYRSDVINVRITIEYTSLEDGRPDPFAYPTADSIGVRIGDQRYPIMRGVDDGRRDRPVTPQPKTIRDALEIGTAINERIERQAAHYRHAALTVAHDQLSIEASPPPQSKEN